MATAKDYANSLLKGKWDSRLVTMYGAERVPEQKQRYTKLLSQANSFEGNVILVSACGRAELGGNHTDHNHGNVLAAGVHLDHLAVATKTETNIVSINSDGFDPIQVDLTTLSPKESEFGTPHSIIRGVASGLVDAGYSICGFDAVITSSVPIGSGLSSSAAFEVLVCNIFSALVNNKLVSNLENARIAKKAENDFFGKPCGFMDQIACAFNGVLHIDFETPDLPVINSIAFDFEEHGYQLAIVQTGGDHANLTPEYAAIPEEMIAAAKCFNKDFARGITVQELMTNAKQVRENASDRAFLRLYHFITENNRAVAKADALKDKDIEKFIKLVNKSSDSSYRFLQNCMSVQDVNSQPIPMAIAMSEFFMNGKGACRVHGGGFAGTIQVVVPMDQFDRYKNYMETCFGKGSVIPLHIRQPGFEFFEL